MNILMVEDDEIKILEIEKLLRGYYKVDAITVCKSLNSGKKMIQQQEFDLIILDMSLPLFEETYNKEDFVTFAGIDILRELDRKEIQTNVIIITAFDILGENKMTLKQLDEEIYFEFESLYKGIIHYENSTTKWIEEFKKIVEGLEK